MSSSIFYCLIFTSVVYIWADTYTLVLRFLNLFLSQGRNNVLETGCVFYTISELWWNTVFTGDLFADGFLFYGDDKVLFLHFDGDEFLLELEKLTL